MTSTFGGSAQEAGWHKKPATLHPPINQALIVNGQRYPFKEDKMPNETKHTPGPHWYDEHTESIGCEAGWIARIEHTRKGDGEFGNPDADGRLYAAAPALLEACKLAYTRLFNYQAGMDNQRDRQATRELNAEALDALLAVLKPFRKGEA